jgi:hypothetical protein
MFNGKIHELSMVMFNSKLLNYQRLWTNLYLGGPSCGHFQLCMCSMRVHCAYDVFPEKKETPPRSLHILPMLSGNHLH